MWKEKVTMLNLLLALGGLNRWGGSACCPPAVYLPTSGAGVDEGVRAGEEAAWSCLHQRMHTHMCTGSLPFPLFLFLSFLPVCCPSPSPPFFISPSYYFSSQALSFSSPGLFESLCSLSPPSFWCLLSLQWCLHSEPSLAPPQMHVLAPACACIFYTIFLLYKYLPICYIAYSVQYSIILYRLVA